MRIRFAPVRLRAGSSLRPRLYPMGRGHCVEPGGGRTRGELRLYRERGGIGVLIPRTGVVKFAGRQLNGAKCGKGGGGGGCRGRLGGV